MSAVYRIPRFNTDRVTRQWTPNFGATTAQGIATGTSVYDVPSAGKINLTVYPNPVDMWMSGIGTHFIGLAYSQTHNVPNDWAYNVVTSIGTQHITMGSLTLADSVPQTVSTTIGTHHVTLGVRNVPETSPVAIPISMGICAALITPILAFPGNMGIYITPTATLRWTACTGATSYNVQVSLSPTFDILYAGVNVSIPSYAPKNLKLSTTYYWRVSSVAAGGSSSWSATHSFTTMPSMAMYHSEPSVSFITNGTKLIWEALDAVTVSIDGYGVVAHEGYIETNATQTTTYTLTATNSAGSTVKTVTIYM